MKITIAIDGYSSCGKSTIAKALASRLGYSYVDSGAMYRAVALYCMRNNLIVDEKFDKEEVIKALKDIKVSFKYNPATKISETYLNGENIEREIRQMDVSKNVSHISVIKEVRHEMVALQREMGKGKGVVMDGRDIGTNVFPKAELKIFMTADVDVRTHRRLNELSSKGYQTSFEEVKKNLLERDDEDTNRKENPLVKAQDAIVLDNTDLSKEEQLEYVLKLISDLQLIKQS